LGVYPNPFNSNIHLKYRVDRPGRIQLTIYDVLGRSVRNLHSYFSTAGEKEIIWDGRNDQAEIVSSGIYFLDTEFYNQKSLRKVVLIR
jgi:flagellar hook assembly protein FlgD